jgi:tRNA A37 methylthiotransferase MiaB
MIITEVDAWIPLKDFAAFEKYLGKYSASQETPKRLTYNAKVHLEDRNYVYLRIADGCNNKCSYCRFLYQRKKGFRNRLRP